MQREATSTGRVFAGMPRRTAIYAFLYGFVLLVIAGMLYVSGAALIGYLVQRFVPGLQELSALPAVMVLTGATLLLLDAYYLALRSGKVRRMMGNLQAQAESWIQPHDVHEEIDPAAVRQVIVDFVRGYQGGFLFGTVIFDCLYAASVSWGLSRLLPDMLLFEGDPEAGFLQHALFWLAIPLDLFLLDAPSSFGFNLTELQPDRDSFGFLMAIFVFKTIIVASVVRLVVAALTFEPDEVIPASTSVETAIQTSEPEHTASPGSGI